MSRGAIICQLKKSSDSPFEVALKAHAWLHRRRSTQMTSSISRTEANTDPCFLHAREGYQAREHALGLNPQPEARHPAGLVDVERSELREKQADAS
jgi:hypothetical protein